MAVHTTRLQAQRTQPVLFAPGVLSGPVNDAAPAFMPDGKTVYFHRGGPGLETCIFVSRSSGEGKWGEPRVAVFSGVWQDIEPAIAPDGSYMIFSSNRPVTSGAAPLDGLWGGQSYPKRGGNLWRVDRKGDGWGTPYRLPEIVNRSSSTFSPAIAANGNLYFMRPVGDTGRFHIFCSYYHDGKYAEPVPVSFSAADTVSDVDPVVAPDESFLVFSSKREGNMDLFIIRKENDHWGTPVNLGPSVNRTHGNVEARLSPDQHTLYFASSYTTPLSMPTDPVHVQQHLLNSQWETGMSNIWSVSLAPWLPVAGPRR